MLKAKPKILIVGEDKNLQGLIKDEQSFEWIVKRRFKKNYQGIFGVIININSESDIQNTKKFIRHFRKISIVGIIKKDLLSYKPRLLKEGIIALEEKPIDGTKFRRIILFLSLGQAGQFRKSLPAGDFMNDMIMLAMDSRSQKTILNRASETFLKIFRADRVSIMILESGSDVLEVKAAVGMPDTVLHYGKKKLGEKIAGWAAENRRPVLLQNGLGNDKRFNDVPKRRNRQNIKSAMLLPIIYGDNLLGIVNITRLTGKKFTKKDVEKANILSIYLGMVLYQVKNIEEIDMLHTAMQGSSDGILSVDNCGSVIIANRSAIHLIGFENTDLLGKMLLDIFGSAIDKQHLEMILVGKTLANLQVRYNHPDGNIRNFSISSSPVFQPDGKFSKSVLTIRDVTSAVKLQNEMMKISQINAFMKWVGEIAHQMNNPLAVLMGNFHILEENINNITEVISDNEPQGSMMQNSAGIKEEIKNVISECSVAGNRISNFIKVLRKLKEDKDNLWTESSVPALIDKAIGILNVENMTHKIKIIPNYQSAPVVRCVSERLLNAFVDVLLNAVEACGIEGEIGITVSQDEGHALIEIQDNGTGMADEELKHIFEPFYTKKNVPGKFGLGLTNIYAVVNMHSGRIWVESSVNEGTKISIRLPLYLKKE
ncbi:MAG TPA: ATP-binding protein [bacterium]